MFLCYNSYNTNSIWTGFLEGKAWIMTITQLTYFKELAKIQHITKTAQALHISQPSLSSALKSLETELGVSLFDRKGKYLTLNEHGQLFLQYVERALNSLDTGKSILASAAYKDVRPVRISFTSTMGYTLIPQLFGNFYQADSGQSIPLVFKHHDVNKEVMNDLITKNADVAFSFSVHDSFSFFPICRDELVVMVPNINPLSRKISLSIRDIKDEPIIVSTKDAYMYDYLTNMFAYYNLKPNVYLAADNNNLRNAYVSLGNCIAIGARLPFNVPNVTMVPLDHPMRYRQIYLCWNHMEETPEIEQVKRHCMSNMDHL